MCRITETQLGMFLEWSADRTSLQYNVTGYYRFPTSVDLDRLGRAVREMVAAHPVFRTRFVERDGEILQAFDSAAEIPYARYDLGDDESVKDFMRSFARPFDLLGGELVRFAFIATPTAHYLAYDISHLIFDGTTLTLFGDEIGARYDALPVASEDASYADFAAVEEASFASAAYAEAAADHKARFAGVPPTLPEDPWFAGGKLSSLLMEACASVDRASVDACCAALGVTPNLFFMGVFARTLHVFSGERKILFETVNHGRRDQAFRRTFGACIKTVPVLGELKGELPLRTYFESFKLHRAGVYPFTHAARDFGLKPGFMFVFQDGTTDLSMPLGGVRYPLSFTGAQGASVLPAVQIYSEESDGVPCYACSASCLPGRYSQRFLDELIAVFASVAANFAQHPDARLGEVPTLSAARCAEMESLSRGEPLPTPAARSFVDLVEDRAAETPEKTAVVDCETSVTYAELVACADRLAKRLRALGVTSGGFVGLMLPRRVSFVVAALAAQKCGAGYVPIDPEYPDDRIAYMLGDSESPVLVTTHALLAGKQLDFAGQTVIVEDEAELDEPEARGGGGERCVNYSTSETPAYMIYTSGSTGRPKGVVVPQRALCHLCAWLPAAYGITSASRIATHPSFSFDASVIDLFPALAAGAELHLYSEGIRHDLPAISDYIVKNGITGGTMSTQIGMTLLDAYPDLPLDYLQLGGEKLLPTAPTKVRIVNGYGPTEFCVCSSYQVVDQSATGEIPIGRPVPGTASYICDAFGQLVPRGVRGELCLAGPQIADGYWRNPEKTAAAFTSVPFAPGRFFYHTGDYACYDEAGLLEFRGRIDFQVKLRGFRIEIGEIEHAAASCAGVEATVALVKEIAGAQHLVLYYTGSAPEETIRAKMAATLTDYMVPDFFVRLEMMPMTPVGKIDRKALPTPVLADGPSEPPANETEARILKVLQEILKTDTFGVTHDFNRLGLTSLGAITFAARLKKACGLSVGMKTLTENPTVRALSAAVSVASVPAAAPTRARPRRTTYPMTENQRGIYAEWLRRPDDLQYNVPAAFRFAGRDPEVLSEAMEKVLAAHPAFKTRFAEKDGEIVQVRRDDFAIQVPVVTLDVEPDAAFFGAAMKPFAPDADVLTRATVYASPTAAYLFLDVHHTVFDGCSVGLVLRDLLSALDGREVHSETYTAFDAALDERDYLESETLVEDDAWFDNYLADAAPTTVATSASGADGAPGELGRVCVRVPDAAIVARARECGVTANAWFATAFTELLKRTGREEDVLVNFVSSGRGDPESQEAVGMFVKTLPFRGIRDAQTFSETVRRQYATISELIDRDRASYAQLSERLGVRPDVLFVFEGGLFDLPEGVSLVSPALKAAKAPLSAIVTPGRGDFELAFEYDRSMYAEKDMSLLLGMFARLAENAASTDVLRAIPLLSAVEAEAALTLSRGEPIDYDATRTVVNLIHANALARPFATAVVDCETSITYGQLVSRADALAENLAKLGVKPGGFVGLMLPRRVGFVVAVLAVQKCGAGYVPMDADYPADRLAYMLSDAEAPVLVTTRALAAGKQLDYAGQIVFLEDAVEVDEPEARGGERCVNLSAPELPAYMIYTSGSTGRPKGVVIPHRALRHLCAWAVPSLGLGQTSRVATHPSFSFDASVIDIFPALAAGAELHIFSEEIRKDLPGMRDYIVKNGITGCTMSTQIGMTLLDAYPDLPLSYLQLGGEKLLPTAPTKVRIVNGYGPTEFCVCSSYQVVDQSAAGDIPIGRPVPGTSSLIVDRYGQLLPQGFAGELALAGPQIADGYWRNPEKTSAAFVTAPYDPSVRLYRTGDLVRYNGAGTLDYMGRLDFQVKLRGFRIEIGEIEHRASTFDGVKGVAAEVREVGGAQHLVLYYGSDAELDETALKAHLAAALTEYMVPDYYVRMDPLPLTPNGKINRRLLPSPEEAPAVEAFVEPASETERKIAAVYGEILKLARYGATTDFFAAGGTSLVGIKAVIALQKAGLDVQYGDLFRYKTPRTLAAFLTGETVSSAAAPSESAFDYGAYDYTAIDRLLAATPTELFDGFRRHSLGDVLLCGATGYLGIHVLHYLLAATDATVYVLVRPKSGVSAEKRLGAQYVYYFGERLPARFRDRLASVEGDITDADLGTKLADLKIGTVINCAALVKHYVADDRMDRVNVGGVENLIAWCAGSGARLVHTSTYSVGGTVRSDSGVQLDERHLYVGQESDNDYIRTKFLAERAVLEAVAEGRLRGKVMRLGNLMGREADGEFQMNVGANAFVNSLKSYHALGAYPLENLASKIEMSPIDRVAEAVCLLATTPDAMCVFHPYNCYPLDMGAVIGAMNRRGLDVDGVSRTAFAASVDALRNDPSRASELQGILHYTGHILKDRRMTPVVNDWTTTVLYRLGFRWRPADDAYLAGFFAMLEGLAVFER